MNSPKIVVCPETDYDLSPGGMEVLPLLGDGVDHLGADEGCFAVSAHQSLRVCYPGPHGLDEARTYEVRDGNRVYEGVPVKVIDDHTAEFDLSGPVIIRSAR